MADKAGSATAGDVARVAGVSKATVSYVLNGRSTGGRISADTRRRVLEAAQRLDYTPNQAARTLRRQLTERICLVIPRLGAPYFETMARELRDAAAERGYSMVIAVDDLDEHGVDDSLVLRQLRQQLADGVVFAAEGIDTRIFAPLTEHGVAVVVVGGDATATDQVDVVRSHLTDACNDAVQHLVSGGHRRIAYVGHFASGHSHLRYQSYLAAMKRSSMAVDQSLVVPGAESRSEAYLAAQQLISRTDRPTAIFAGSDVAAVSAVWAARDAGLTVPDDLAVIGVGDIPEDAVMHPPLTTIGPKNSATAEIIDLLFSRLDGQAARRGRRRTQEWQLIIRGSA